MGGADLGASPARLETLRANLAEVRARVVAAASDAGRDAAALTLVAVSKTWPAADVAALLRLGVVDFAENREQEATTKVAQVADLISADLAVEAGGFVQALPVWHFVGQLQTNKAAAVARFAGCVQSVDRERLVAALSRAAVAHGREVDVCVQVSLDSPVGASGGRGGVDPSQLAPLADAVADAPGLRLAGVMGVAPRGESARKAFARLRSVSESLVRGHPQATVISAGMSSDLEDAVAEGATHLRIGTALFGERASVP